MTIKSWLLAFAWLPCLAIAGSAKTRDYQKPDVATFIKLENAFAQLFDKGTGKGLQAFYQSREKPHQIWFETDPQLGWGRVYYHLDPAPPWFLQVPHRYHDKWTWDIAKVWRDSGVFKVVMVNTVHRYAAVKGDKAYSSDWSVSTHNPMLAASRAFIRHNEKARVFQLHGFNPAKRKDERGREAQVILSHGVKLEQDVVVILSSTAKCLESRLKIKALTYPNDVIELGGTKNLVALSHKERGRSLDFMHIELAFELRQRLVKHPEQSRQFLQCIVGEVG